VIPISILDLVPVCTGSTPGAAIRDIVQSARKAEELGYQRYWFAEHHGVGNFGSSAPEILIAHVASATSKIRVGAGGILLNNHPPLRVAEVFTTLEALYPGRIDLGIGRTNGGDPATARALRAFPPAAFEEQLKELVGISRRSLKSDHPFAKIHVVPGETKLPSIWVLGSSGSSAQLAGELGFGYGYARHLRTSPGPALEKYRKAFRPSEQTTKPHAILSVAVICAPTTEEANELAKSTEIAQIQRLRGDFLPLPSPSEASSQTIHADEVSTIEEIRRRDFVGTPQAVVTAVRALAHEVHADEVMVMTMIHGQAERERSYSLFAEEWFREAITTGTKIQRNRYAYTAAMGQDTVLMSVERGDYFKIDAVALNVWNRLETPIEVGRLCSDISDFYRGDPLRIERDVIALLKCFEQNKLLERTEG